MYIIEEMLSMNFNFFILKNYEFLTLSSTFDINNPCTINVTNFILRPLYLYNHIEK
jgi:hypothetical protein